MRKRDRILKKERARAEQRRRKAAVYILGFHRLIFTPASIRSSLAMKQIQPAMAEASFEPCPREPRSPLDPKLPWWRQPTSALDIDLFRERMGYTSPRSYHDLLWICRRAGGKRLETEMEMLSRTWRKPTKAARRAESSLRRVLSVIGGTILFGAMYLAHKYAAESP